MPTPDVSENVDLNARNQRLLCELLTTDLKLAATFLSVADVTNDPDHERQTCEHVRVALSSIRKLSRRIEDEHTRRDIEKRLGELEKEMEQRR